MKREISNTDREILSLIAHLSKALRCCRRDEVFCADVTFAQFQILDAIAQNRTLGMAALHEILSVDKSTTTRLVAPLIRRGLVVRERADYDSRAAKLIMTEDGREVHARVWQCLISFIRAVQEVIPEEKRASVWDGTRLFLEAMSHVSVVRCAGSSPANACKCVAKS
jgi:DNA-binding MarR family transcriptional regulator